MNALPKGIGTAIATDVQVARTTPDAQVVHVGCLSTVRQGSYDDGRRAGTVAEARILQWSNMNQHCRVHALGSFCGWRRLCSVSSTLREWTRWSRVRASVARTAADYSTAASVLAGRRLDANALKHSRWSGMSTRTGRTVVLGGGHRSPSWPGTRVTVAGWWIVAEYR
jgi:hypothetical protein